MQHDTVNKRSKDVKTPHWISSPDDQPAKSQCFYSLFTRYILLKEKPRSLPKLSVLVEEEIPELPKQPQDGSTPLILVKEQHRNSV
eukprot:m.144863 g.144863  ORF g.144863 m.144863 type:complete len:86 (+) comp38407_c3_seq30:2650-2907(+)